MAEAQKIRIQVYLEPSGTGFNAYAPVMFGPTHHTVVAYGKDREEALHRVEEQYVAFIKGHKMEVHDVDVYV